MTKNSDQIWPMETNVICATPFDFKKKTKTKLIL